MAGRRSRCRRNRKTVGGGGAGYTFGAAVAPEARFAPSVVSYPSCDYAQRDGYLANARTQGGLPGFNGQSGGARYTFVPEVWGANPITLSPSIACDAAQQNQLNMGDVSKLVTAVPAQAPSPVPGGQGYAPWSAKGGKRVGGVDSMAYQVPRAGYTFVPSNNAGGQSGTLSDGKAPFALNYPYLSVPKVSPACLTTGGSRKNKKASRKNKKASRKNRKASRKSSRKSSK